MSLPSKYRPVQDVVNQVMERLYLHTATSTLGGCLPVAALKPLASWARFYAMSVISTEMEMEEPTLSSGSTQYIAQLHGLGKAVCCVWNHHPHYQIHRLIKDCVKLPQHMDFRKEHGGGL